MIYTLTLNPSVDYFVQLNTLDIGTLNRSLASDMRPGGKGINVSRVLKRLGVDSRALGFVGGFTGEFIRTQLLSEGVTTDFTEIEGSTRINVKITASEETEINGAMTSITDSECEELYATLDQVGEGDILVLAGSVPASLPTDIYKRLMVYLKTSGVKVIIDSSGVALKEALEMRPFLIKPNQHELGDLFDVDIQTVEEAIHYGKKLLVSGINHLIISLGANGALFLNNDQVIKATVPTGEARSAVGAGDSLVAGFLAAVDHGLTEAEAFKQGVAAGTATAFSEGLCDQAAVQAILPEIKCEVLEGSSL